MSRIFSWTLNAIYLLVLLLASPWILRSAFKHGKYREGFGAKVLGLVPVRHGSATCIWLHAVSVGEVNLLGTLIDRLTPVHYSTTRPRITGEGDFQIFISTTTKAGFELAQKKYAAHTVFYCPLDFSWATREAMRRVRPDLLVLAELELWPNLIAAAKEQGVRVAIINGRLSDRSFRGYLRILPVVARLLRKIDLIAAQNVETAERFCKLGARAESVYSTGSLKFDGAQTDRENARTRELQALARFAADDVVFLAGSTQAPEEAMAIRIYQSLVAEFSNLRLVIVPRHPQRFDEVAGLLEQSGIDWVRRSELDGRAKRARCPALLVDTVGELGAWWGAASVGFVGGSFGSRGGQNMLEPAAYGVATCFGPNTWNFRDIVAQLLDVEGAKIVADEKELMAFVHRTMAEPEWGVELGKRARQLVLDQQGATERTLDLLLPLVDCVLKVDRAA